MDEFTVECDEDVVDDVKRLMFKAYSEASDAMHQWHRDNSKWFLGNDLPSFAIQLQSGSAVGDDYFSVH